MVDGQPPVVAHKLPPHQIQARELLIMLTGTQPPQREIMERLLHQLQHMLMQLQLRH